MAKPWQVLDRADTADGTLELRRRGEDHFLITINGRVLMNSSSSRSEIVLGQSACNIVAARKQPRVLVGGLGMGLTLRAVLDSLPSSAHIVVAELNPVVVAWCRGPLSGLTDCAVDDPRVTVMIDDVSSLISKAARPGAERFDAVIIDLYEGPGAETDVRDDPFYGSLALKRTAAALSPGGVFAVWGENSDPSFEKRLSASGFYFDRQRPGKGGFRHVVYLASIRTGLGIGST